MKALWHLLKARFRDTFIAPITRRHHASSASWAAMVDRHLAEGYVVQHGFCPHCASYMTAMVFPENATQFGECNSCRQMTTGKDTARLRALIDSAPSGFAKHPAAPCTLEEMESIFIAYRVTGAPDAARRVWYAITNKILARYE